jgi:hypothetical protein
MILERLNPAAPLGQTPGGLSAEFNLAKISKLLRHD